MRWKYSDKVFIGSKNIDILPENYQEESFHHWYEKMLTK